MYTRQIKPRIHHAVDATNSQEIVMDIVGNLTQIGKWTLKGFSQQKTNIELFLQLTRKSIMTLSGRQLNRKFQPTFDTFCQQYDKLEKEYSAGITDHQEWAQVMNRLATTLTQHSHLV